MYLIDTNIIISQLLVEYEQDEQTQLYRNFYNSIPFRQRVIPDFVLNEVEVFMRNVVPSRYGKCMLKRDLQEMKDATTACIGHFIEECTLTSPSVAMIKLAFSYYKQLESAHYISFTDCLLLAVAKESGYTIISRDERLNEQAKGLRILFYQPNK